jgi:hypothetical protein
MIQQSFMWMPHEAGELRRDASQPSDGNWRRSATKWRPLALCVASGSGCWASRPTTSRLLKSIRAAAGFIGTNGL